jgi:hypothetical protein
MTGPRDRAGGGDQGNGRDRLLSTAHLDLGEYARDTGTRPDPETQRTPRIRINGHALIDVDSVGVPGTHGTVPDHVELDDSSGIQMIIQSVSGGNS